MERGLLYRRRQRLEHIAWKRGETVTRKRLDVGRRELDKRGKRDRRERGNGQRGKRRGRHFSQRFDAETRCDAHESARWNRGDHRRRQPDEHLGFHFDARREREARRLGALHLGSHGRVGPHRILYARSEGTPRGAGEVRQRAGRDRGCDNGGHERSAHGGERAHGVAVAPQTRREGERRGDGQAQSRGERHRVECGRRERRDLAGALHEAAAAPATRSIDSALLRRHRGGGCSRCERRHGKEHRWCQRRERRGVERRDVAPRTDERDGLDPIHGHARIFSHSELHFAADCAHCAGGEGADDGDGERRRGRSARALRFGRLEVDLRREKLRRVGVCRRKLRARSEGQRGEPCRRRRRNVGGREPARRLNSRHPGELLNLGGDLGENCFGEPHALVQRHAREERTERLLLPHRRGGGAGVLVLREGRRRRRSIGRPHW